MAAHLQRQLLVLLGRWQMPVAPTPIRHRRRRMTGEIETVCQVCVSSANVHHWGIHAFGLSTSKGQVTIPAEIREQAGLLPHTEVEFEYDGSAVRIVRTRTRKSVERGRRVVEHLSFTS
jgi:AbrB family looped-hinge helix DNA binding protein